MSTLERYENRLLDKAVNGGASSEKKDDLSEDHSDSDASLDEILEELDYNEDNEFLQQYREQRLQQIATDMRKIKGNVESENYGQLTTVENENEIMRLTTNTDQVVIHFGLESFRKCRVMDSKLSQLASKHLLTKFLRVSVDKCPFLVSKLQVQVLPFVVAYKNGVERTRIVGFAQLGNQPDDFDVSVLENVLFGAGVLANRAGSHKLRFGETEDNGSDLDI
ncbi:LAFA_0G08262g1_1 [Lachancea sp. 'fantastica']|nr:LAFA_0G08262g1_1 [Lachancea sp. 'fantastica']